MTQSVVWLALAFAALWLLLSIDGKLKSILEFLEQHEFDERLEQSDLMKRPPIID